MSTLRTWLFVLIILFIGGSALAQSPAAAEWADWSMSESPEDPGVLSADSLLDAPAGRLGGVVVRDGHFFTGDRRLRLWGVNIAFGANFPSHDEADRLAVRFSRFGINAVRFHHMDNQPFPNGIFADGSLETLSTEALDRLDYFIAALKSRGIYADLNLHVSRNYNHYHKTTDGKDGPRIDKMVDLFDPELIAAQKKYAADLLGHVNAYTHNTYATEPAVAIVEINNENSLFMWGSEKSLAQLPEPYAAELKEQWNEWLGSKYTVREKLAAAWSAGLKPAGANLLRDTQFAAIGREWIVETHNPAYMTASVGGDHHAVKLNITSVDGTPWHLQFNQPRLSVDKGEQYTVSFAARSDQPMEITASVAQAHDPWQVIGSSSTVVAHKDWKTFEFAVTPVAADKNARLSFAAGQDLGTLEIADVAFHVGGGTGAADDEDPTLGTVHTTAEASFNTGPRLDDWHNFLQETEQNYYVGMQLYLKNPVGVKCPITGTIGFGPMGTEVQSKMDFVDAHAYWEHPSFPHRQWDMSDWTMANKAMVDDPEHATLWGLAATRVAGKPFTVTEYQHPAPNDYEAECIPFIASYAASQDWDGIFLFAYSHDSNYQKQKISSFFDIEGNPTKIPLMPMGSRIFLGDGGTAQPMHVFPISHEQELGGASRYGFDEGLFVRQTEKLDWNEMLSRPIGVSFGRPIPMAVISNPCEWTSSGPGTGRFTFSNRESSAFVGFSAGKMPIAIGTSGVRIESMASPFATIIVQTSSPKKTIDQSDELLISAVAGARNSNMQWDAGHHSVGNHWGNPPVQIEVVQGELSLPGKWGHAYALDPHGQPTDHDVAVQRGDRTIIKLGSATAIAYRVVR